MLRNKIKIVLQMALILIPNVLFCQKNNFTETQCKDSLFMTNVYFEISSEEENNDSIYQVYRDYSISGWYFDTLIISNRNYQIRNSLFCVCFINDSTYRVKEFFMNGAIKGEGICILKIEEGIKHLYRSGQWRIRFSQDDELKVQEFY